MAFINKLSVMIILFVFPTVESTSGIPVQVDLSSRDKEKYMDSLNVQMELGKLERAVANTLVRLFGQQKGKSCIWQLS